MEDPHEHGSRVPGNLARVVSRKDLHVFVTTSRRTVALSAMALAALTALTACSSGGAGEAGGESSANAETRTVVSEAGEFQVPVDPQTIVALDEPAALNLLSIGIVPAVAFDSWRTGVPKAILEAEGVEIAATASFYPEVEEVASYDPDLIVGTAAEGFTQYMENYVDIAPLIGGLYGAPGTEIITAYGEYFEREAEAAKVADALGALADEAAAAQTGEAGQSLSVLMSYAQENMPLYMDATNSLHGTIADAGFTRPALQDEVPEGGSAFGGWTVFSPEQLSEQDADVLAIAVASQYNLEGITDMPLYPSLQAVANGKMVEVDGDLWSGGAAFYTYWVLSDLASFAAGDYTPGTAADGEARWAAFTAATEG